MKTRAINAEDRSIATVRVETCITDVNETWESIYSTPLPHRAELAKALLLEHEIPAVVINKQSSSYPTIGWGKSEVHVRVKDAILAKVILENEATFS